MPRTFTRASSHSISLSVGGVSGGANGQSLAFIVKKGSDLGSTNYQAFWAGRGSNDGQSFYPGLDGEAANAVWMWSGSSISSAPFTYATSEGWVLLAFTKSGGLGAWRYHKYVYGTDTHSHGAPATSHNEHVAPSAGLYFGRSFPGDFFNGDVAMGAVWNATTLSDAAIERLPFSLMAWFYIQPSALWILDQSNTSQKVNDLTGGGAKESGISGTTVSTNSVPIFTYGSGIM